MGLFEQFVALYIKNALVAWRGRRATILRLLAPLIFLLLALLIDKALQGSSAVSENFKDVTTPDSIGVGSIPSCHDAIFIGRSNCTELAYSPVNAITQTIMANILAKNAIPISAMGFVSRDAAQDYLWANPNTFIAGVHFVFSGPQLQGFVIQTNTSSQIFKSTTIDPNFFVQLPLQSAAHREIARYQLSLNPATQGAANSLSWVPSFMMFPHPTIATQSVLGQVLGPFIFAACMFAFVTQIGTVVMEKETGLRQALRTMGMTDAAYWMSWGAWELTLAFLTGHLIAIYGLILQFDLFLHTSYGLLFFLFFLFQLSMSSMALFISTFVSKTQTAVYLGFLIFIIGWIMQTVVIFGVPFTPSYWLSSPLSELLTILCAATPWSLLVKGFNDMGSATIASTSPGIRWSERSSYCQNIPSVADQNTWAVANSYDPSQRYVSFVCVLPLDLIYKVLVALWILYFVCAIYLDNVLPNEFGMRRPVLYFLYPSYWFPAAVAPADALGHVLREDGLGSAEPAVDVDEDVLAEEARMRGLLNHRTGSTGKEGELAATVDVRNAVEVFGLKKKYDGSSGCCGHSLLCCGVFDCCSCNAVPSFWPIKGSWFGIEQNQLFCLLGPNGAGKTTTINCLTGVLSPTHGDALIYGQSIKSTNGMDKIRSMMGVCPQFDVLWPELSGREHLMLFGRIKGVRGWGAVKAETETLLDKVKLTYAADQRSGAYSGGMKRRLSVAIALLGDPKVVYLDEPTTGMDPISRRYVWDIIQEAKVGRAIILTTHSMEEADILGDRIAIMALGRLRCIASSIRLKQRFGAGYQIAVSVQNPRASQQDLAALDQRGAAVKDYFRQHLALEPEEEGRVYTSYLVAREREADLQPFLAQLEADAPRLGITDIQLSLTSLEEVFLTIARKAALQAAQTTPGGYQPKKKDLPFCLTCLKGVMLALTCPISIFFYPKWGRFIVGKQAANTDCSVTLPDGAVFEVPPGQEYIHDERGQAYKVIWGVDDKGNLVAESARPIAAAPGDAHVAPGLLIAPGPMQMAGSSVVYTAVQGKARVPMPGNVLMEVAVGNMYVINPTDGMTYCIQWGKDAKGKDAVLSCSPLPPQLTANGAGGMPVAQPVRSRPSSANDRQPIPHVTGGNV